MSTNFRAQFEDILGKISRFHELYFKVEIFSFQMRYCLLKLSQPQGIMEARRQRVADLLDAQVSVRDIMNIVKCCKNFVYMVKRKHESGEGLARKPGSGGLNKKLTAEVLADLLAKIKADPIRSMQKLAKELNVHEKTVRTAVGKLGLHSYMRRRRQLLTKTSRERCVELGKKLIFWLKKKPPSTVLVFFDKKN